MAQVNWEIVLLLHGANVDALDEVFLEEGVENHERQNRHDNRRVGDGVLRCAAVGSGQVRTHDDGTQLHLEVVQPLVGGDVELVVGVIVPVGDGKHQADGRQRRLEPGYCPV